MSPLKIGFVGARMDRSEAAADFFERVLGLQPAPDGTIDEFIEGRDLQTETR